MDFKQAIQHVLQNYATFEGRACRSEYWYWVLGVFVVNLLLDVIGLRLIGLIFSLATIVPSIAVAVRRMHDIDKTGWLLLIGFVPILGWIVVIYWLVQPTGGPNQYGEGPLGVGVPAVPS